MHFIKYKKSYTLLGFILLLVIGGVTFNKIDTAQSATSATTCSSIYNLLADDGTTGDTSLSNIAYVTLALPTGTTSPTLSRVILRANGQPIGQLRPGPDGTNYWRMAWVTQLFAYGGTAKTASLEADLITPSGPFCTTYPRPVTVINTTSRPPLLATPAPTSWQGAVAMGTPMQVIPNASNTTIDIKPYAIYEWTTGLGSFTSITDNVVQYFSGFTAGTSEVSTNTIYGGSSVVTKIPVKVEPSGTPLPTTPTTTTTTTTSTSSPTTTTTSPTAAATTSTSPTKTTATTTGPTNTTTSTSSPTTTTTSPTAAPTTPTTISSPTTSATEASQALQASPIAQNCLLDALGQERYSAVNNNEIRPTSQEMQKIVPCFASSNYLIPANFSPIKPQAIKELTTKNDLAVARPKNVQRQTDTATITGLLLSGKAKPNSQVIIYVFSDPLVLTTTSDADGNWTYTLENPIETGEHEVYTVVDRGDGEFERSAPVSFFIKTAAASPANPQGLSLLLDEKQTPSQSNSGLIFYLLSASALICLVLAGFFVILNWRKHHQTLQPAMQTFDSLQPANNSDNEQFFGNPIHTPGTQIHPETPAAPEPGIRTETTYANPQQPNDTNNTSTSS